MHARSGALCSALLTLAAASASIDHTPLRVAGSISQHQTHIAIEQAVFDGLAESTGGAVVSTYNPMDVVGVKAPDALRMLRAGSFDVMSMQIGMASRADPFFEAST